MALPQSVSGVGFENYDMPSVHRPSNGNHYAPLRETATAQLIMVFADDGDNAWSEVDAAGASAQAALNSIHSQLVGTDIHVVTSHRSGTSADYYYHVFDTTAGTNGQWSTVDEVIATGVLANISNNQFLNAQLAVRSDGSVVAFVIGASEKIHGTEYERVDYIIRSTGGSWGSFTAVDDGGEVHFNNPVCTLGASDKVHLCYFNDTSNAILHKSLTSGGSLSSAETVNDNAPQSDPRQTMLQLAYFDNAGTERIVVFWLDGSQNGVYSYIDNDGTPQAETTGTDNTVDITDDLMARLVVDDTNDTVYLLYADSSTRDLWLATNWGTDEELLDATTIENLAAGTVTTRDSNDLVLPYFYEASGVKYDEYLIEAGTGGAQTISTSAATIASTGHTATVTPGAVTIQATPDTLASAAHASLITIASTIPTTPATLASSAQPATIVVGAVTVQATASSLVSAGHTATLTPGGVSISATVDTLATGGQAASILPGAATVTTTAAILASSGHGVSIVPGSISVQAALGVLTSAGQTATISAGGGAQTINTATVTLASGTHVGSIVAGAVSITATLITLASAGQAASIQPGAVTIQSALTALMIAGQTGNVVVGAVSVATTTTTLSSAGLAASIQSGGSFINATLATVASAGHTSSILPGAVTIQSVTDVVDSAGQATSIQSGGSIINAPVATLASAGYSSSLIPGAISIPSTASSLASSGLPSAIESTTTIATTEATLTSSGQSALLVPGTATIQAVAVVLTAQGFAAVVLGNVFFDPNGVYVAPFQRWGYATALESWQFTPPKDKRAFVSVYPNI